LKKNLFILTKINIMTTKTLISLLIICIIQITTASSNAQTPLWQGKGRIAISSDGNEHDHDDWAATPLSLALLAAAGLQDNLVIYTYSDHIWGSNQSHTTSASGLNSYLHMRESALGGQKWFGFDKTKFVCAVDNAEVAYTALRDVINESTADNPLIIIAAGPMQSTEQIKINANLSPWFPIPTGTTCTVTSQARITGMCIPVGLFRR
jgi:hypothetical protein